jgi:Predicted amidohydrolase
MERKELRVILAQCPIIWNEPKENLQRMEVETRFAAGIGADLIVFPEVMLTGFNLKMAQSACPWLGHELEHVQLLAQECQIAIASSAFVSDGGEGGWQSGQPTKFYNRAYIMLPDGEVYTQNKRHLFSMAGEDRVLTPGDRRQSILYRGWRIRLITCYDLRFPIWCRNQILPCGSLDYDLLLVVANWPTPRIVAWRTLLQARAIENISYTIGVNRIGTDPHNTDYSGESAAFDHLGRPLVEFMPYEDGCRRIVLEREALESSRQKFPVWRDSDSFIINT